MCLLITFSDPLTFCAHCHLSPAGSQNAEGVAYLHQAIVTLNEKHVQYAHGAYDDLKARLAAVQDAVGQQVRGWLCCCTAVQHVLRYCWLLC